MMNFQQKRYKLAGRFIVVYVLIVTVLSAAFIFSFGLYRDSISRFEIGLETGALVAEVSPLIEQALDQGNVEQAVRLSRLLFASANVSCVDVRDEAELVLAWPPGGCASLHNQQTATDAQNLISPHVTSGGLIVSVGLDASYGEELDWQYTKGFTLMMLVIMAVIGLVFSALLFLFILRPLARLQQVISTPSGGSVPPHPSLQLPESGALGQTFAVLLERARAYLAELQRSEQFLNQTDEQIKNITALSSDWIFELDEHLCLNFVSPAFFERTGTREQDMLGLPLAELAEHYEEGDNWSDHFKILEKRQPFQNIVYKMKTSEEKEIYLSVNGTPVFEPNGRFTGYRGTVRDVSLLYKNRAQLEEVNRDLGESVAYASHLQHKLLVKQSELEAAFGEVRFVWQPRDLVGGDFMTHFSIAGRPYLAFYDCTGHGVPGGFMVFLVSASLDRIKLRNSTALSCADVLQQLHQEICRSLDIPEGAQGTDGLDCAVISLNDDRSSLEYAGANIDLYTIDDRLNICRHAASKVSLGYQNSSAMLALDTVHIPVAGNSFLLMTDGIVTQIGEQAMRIMGRQKLLSYLQNARSSQPEHIANAVVRGLRSWQGKQERRDDVMIFSFRPRP